MPQDSTDESAIGGKEKGITSAEAAAVGKDDGSGDRPTYDSEEVEQEHDIEARLGSTSSIESHESPNPPPPLSKTQSRSSSAYREAITVPRAQRRGLLSRFTIIAEVENSYDLPRKKKWIITAIVGFAGIAAPSGSTVIFPSLGLIAKDFNTSPVIANMSVAFYMLSMAIFPLWWSSFSETLGRRTIYVLSFLIFFVFNILSAVSVNISMFIVMRIMAGGASASVQAVGAGTVADIWEVKERGRAMGYFFLGPLCGPLFAPIIGGILSEKLGWRAAVWSQVVYGGLLWIAIVFLLPETLKNRKPIVAEAEADAVAAVVNEQEKSANANERPPLSRTSTRQSVKIKTKKYAGVLHRCFIDPLKIILHLRKPPVAVSVYYAAMTFASLYILSVSIQTLFGRAPYNYNTLIIGLLYIPNSMGYFLASIFGGPWVDRIMLREAKNAGRIDEKGKPIFRPEDRMRENIWLAAFMYPIALIWYGWTADKGVNVAAPMIANFFFGVGSMLVFGTLTTMLTEFMPSQASNGVAVNNFVRNILSCIGAIVAEPLINAIGNGWLFTILGLWTLLSGIVVVWAMKHYAERWRASAAKAAQQNKSRAT